jgi:hypothetical protein
MQHEAIVEAGWYTPLSPRLISVPSKVGSSAPCHEERKHGQDMDLETEHAQTTRSVTQALVDNKRPI